MLSSGAGRRPSILDGHDDRLLVVVGPCSVHDPVAALDYAERLADLADRQADDLFIVMRVYFEKPRTIAGWKGLINDPGLDGSFRVDDGLPAARPLLLDILAPRPPGGLRVPRSDHPAVHRRHGELGRHRRPDHQSQIHRQLASGLPCRSGSRTRPTATSRWRWTPCAAAARPTSSRASRRRPGRRCRDRGEPRQPCGPARRRGRARTTTGHVADALDRLAGAGLPAGWWSTPATATAGRTTGVQPLVAADIAQRMAAGERGLVGVMLESFLRGRRQDPAL